MKQKALLNLVASLILSLGFLLAMFSSTAFGVVQTYDDANPNNVWDLITPNWDGSTALWGNGNQAVFGGNGETVELSGNIAATNNGATFAIAFQAAAGGYNLTDTNNDATLTLGSASAGNMILSNNTSGVNTISENIILAGGGAKVFQQNAGGGLVISGNISESTAGTSITLSRVSGTTAFTLSGANTYTGGTTIATASMRLNINSAGALGTGALTFGSSTGSLDNTSGNAVVLSNNNAVTINADMNFIGSSSLSFGTGVATLTGNRTITVGGSTLTLGGVAEDATGGRTLSKNGAGTLLINGNSSYTGATSVTAGILAAASANAFGSTPVINIGGSGTLSLRGDTSTVFARADNATPYLLNMTATGSTINVDQATVAGTASKTMTIGTVGSTSTTASQTLNLTGANNTGLNIGGITSSTVTTAASTFVVNNTNTSGVTTIGSYTSGNTTGGDTFRVTGTGNTVVSGTIAPSATVLNLQKQGVGTLTLTGASTYTGTTAITGGTLFANNTVNSGATTVTGAGVTLGGTGALNTGAANVTINTGANLSPGTSPGIFSISGTQTGTPASAAAATLNLATGSNFVLELGGATAGNGAGFYDRVNLVGNASVGGSNIVISIVNGYNPAVGSAYTVLLNDGTSDAVLGTFAAQAGVAANQAVANNGQVFDISYAGGDGNDIVLTATAVFIPEPSTYVMVAFGAALLVYFQRARRRV